MATPITTRERFQNRLKQVAETPVVQAVEAVKERRLIMEKVPGLFGKMRKQTKGAAGNNTPLS